MTLKPSAAPSVNQVLNEVGDLLRRAGRGKNARGRRRGSPAIAAALTSRAGPGSGSPQCGCVPPRPRRAPGNLPAPGGGRATGARSRTRRIARTAASVRPQGRTVHLARTSDDALRFLSRRSSGSVRVGSGPRRAGAPRQARSVFRSAWNAWAVALSMWAVTRLGMACRALDAATMLHGGRGCG
jgi:hypothetical protein